MMRAMFTSSAGMKAQQLNVDMIANNLANVSTVAYKKERPEFKDLFYETMERAYMLEDSGKPVNLQVGHGVALKSTSRDFTTGSFEQTDNNLDFAIQGDSFFSIMAPDGNIYYTRDGAFKLSITEDGNKLTTADGYPVLDETGEEIIFDFSIEKLNVSDLGDISYLDEDDIPIPTGQTIGLFKFPNNQGLLALGGNMYKETSGSGYAQLDSEIGERSYLRKGYLEASNVQVVDEMVKLIAAQRAYELNSKAIQSSDEMLGMANGLKR